MASENWTTEDELDFIAGIGTHGKSSTMNRRELLEGYLAGARRRMRWGNINSDEVFAAVEGELMAAAA